MDDLRIIQYLDGEMSGEELREFEDEIRMSPALAEEVKRFRQIQDLARKLLADQGVDEGGPKVGTKGPAAQKDQETGKAKEQQDIEEPDPEVMEEISAAVEEFKKDPSSYGDVPDGYRENLQEAERSYFEGRTGTGSMRMIRRIWYTAAAVVIVALVISIVIFRPFARLSADEIYAEYFRAVPKTDEVIELARADNDFLFAIEVYEAGDYERAAVLFEMLADSADLRPWSLLYAGTSYMSLNQTDNAIEFFRTILEEDYKDVASPARWHLALCYIRQGKGQAATEMLEILRSDPRYRKDAGRILRILRQ